MKLICIPITVNVFVSGYQSQQALFDSVLQCDYQAVLDSDACATLLTRSTTSAYDEEQISLWLIENVQAYHSDEETEELIYSKLVEINFTL